MESRSQRLPGMSTRVTGGPDGGVSDSVAGGAMPRL